MDLETPKSTTISSSKLFISWFLYYLPSNIINLYLFLVKLIWRYFSIVFLLRTIFFAWKRDIYNPVNPTLGDLFQSVLGNFVSRIMGFVVRSFTVISGLVLILATSIIFIIILPMWFLVIPILIYLIIAVI